MISSRLHSPHLKERNNYAGESWRWNHKTLDCVPALAVRLVKRWVLSWPGVHRLRALEGATLGLVIKDNKSHLFLYESYRHFFLLFIWSSFPSLQWEEKIKEKEMFMPVNPWKRSSFRNEGWPGTSESFSEANHQSRNSQHSLSLVSTLGIFTARHRRKKTWR